MKYKIKVEVMQDGGSRCYPMVKKHWWSPWVYILNTIETSFSTKMRFYRSINQAKIIIDEYMSHTLDHTYEIPYKEEEE